MGRSKWRHFLEVIACFASSSHWPPGVHLIQYFLLFWVVGPIMTLFLIGWLLKEIHVSVFNDLWGTSPGLTPSHLITNDLLQIIGHFSVHFYLS